MAMPSACFTIRRTPSRPTASSIGWLTASTGLCETTAPFVAISSVNGSADVVRNGVGRIHFAWHDSSALDVMLSAARGVFPPVDGAVTFVPGPQRPSETVASADSLK